MLRRIALGLTLLLGLSGLAWAGQLEDQAAEIEDILQLAARGVSNDLIIKHIEARGFVYDLTADEILDLRDRGIGEEVIAAMLDTAIDNRPSSREREPVVVEDDGRDSDVYLSAGYFSPWYYYPYAWGYYYDPFPALYSWYYYPFSFSIGWGWYGGSSYWYPGYWPGYGWCDPYYYDYAYCHPGCWVPSPYGSGSNWESGRGLHNDRNAPGAGAHTGEPVNRVHQAAGAGREGQPVTSVRSGASVSGARTGQSATQVRGGQPATQVRQAESASRVRSGQSASRVRTPSASRSSEPVLKRVRTTRPGQSAESPRVSGRVSRDRVHTRSSVSRSTQTSRREVSLPVRRPAESQAAPRSQSGSAVTRPSRSPSSSSFRAPSLGSFSRPSMSSGARMGGRVSAPSAPRGGGGTRGR